MPTTDSRRTVIRGFARDVAGDLPEGSVDTVVTSPPYFLQRDYGEETARVWGADPGCSHEWVEREVYNDSPIRSEGGAGMKSSDDPAELRRERWRTVDRCESCDAWRGQLGHEPDGEEFLAHLLEIIDALESPLAARGSLWINLADGYSDGHRDNPPRKSLRLLPERLALAMERAGWLVRERVAWCKPNPTPNGKAIDRATKSWEHAYRFVRGQDYHDQGEGLDRDHVVIQPEGVGGSHFAPMPEAFARKLIRRSTPRDGLVFDPFCGSGNVLRAAKRAGRDWLGCDPNAEFVELARSRLADVQEAATYKQTTLRASRRAE